MRHTIQQPVLQKSCFISHTLTIDECLLATFMQLINEYSFLMNTVIIIIMSDQIDNAGSIQLY